MDGHGFDMLTKRLALLTTRRRGLRLALAGAGVAGLLGLDREDAEAACGGPGTRCKNGNRCCSGICLRGRKKKGKKGKKKGRCDCSFPQEACNVANDCCFGGSSCGDNGCDPGNNCCFGEGAECIDPCECCTGFTCFFEGVEEFGQCVPCLALQDACTVGVDFCCGDGSFCDSNGGSGDVCCLGAGLECSDDLDCCEPGRCSQRADNTCQNCAALTEFCNGNSLNCCHAGAQCLDNACGADNVCCLKDGQSCEDDCDCCEDNFCHPTTRTCQFDLGRQAPEAESVAPSQERSAEQDKQARTNAKSRRQRTSARNRRRRR